MSQKGEMLSFTKSRPDLIRDSGKNDVQIKKGGIMHYLKIIILSLVIIVILGGCSKTTEAVINSIIGNWFMAKTVEISNENGEVEIDEEIYDPAYDNYYSAGIISITEDNLISYGNEPGEEYETEYYTYEVDGDNFVMFWEGEEVNSMLQYFEDNMLVFEWEYEEDDVDYIEKYYFSPYNGDIPPEIWVTELQNDNYEPDDSYQDATLIDVGGTGQNHIITANDEDWFEFQATEGNTYLIVITGNMDNVLTLYDTDGISDIAQDDDNDEDIDVGYDVESVIVWDCDISGDYYFRITGYYDEEDVEEGFYTTFVSLTDLKSIQSKDSSIKKDIKERHFTRSK